jgi:hypothetical protein
MVTHKAHPSRQHAGLRCNARAGPGKTGATSSVPPSLLEWGLQKLGRDQYILHINP